MRRIVPAVLLAAAMLGSSWTGADAALKRYATTTTATFNGVANRFEGQLSSSKAKCLNARKIQVFHPNGDLIGSGISAPLGEWQVPVAPLTVAGYYRVKVKKREYRRIVCRSTSNTFLVT